jgi:hypothetical protein
MDDFGIVNYQLNDGDTLDVLANRGLVFLHVQPDFLFGKLHVTADNQTNAPLSLNRSDRLFFSRHNLKFHYFDSRSPCAVTIWYIPTYCSTPGYSYHSSHQRSVTIDFRNISSPVPICYMLEFPGKVIGELSALEGEQASVTVMEVLDNGSWHKRPVVLKDGVPLDLQDRFVLDVPFSSGVVFHLKIHPISTTWIADWANAGGPFRTCTVGPETGVIECHDPLPFNFKITEDRAMAKEMIVIAAVIAALAFVASLLLCLWDALMACTVRNRMQPLATVPSIPFT